MKTKELIEHWNAEIPIMAMEEAGEFIHAVSKYARWTGRTDDAYILYEKRQSLMDAIADTYIMLDAITKYYDLDEDEIMRRKEK